MKERIIDLVSRGDFNVSSTIKVIISNIQKI